MKFRKKPIIVDATQWFRNGDHPQDDCSVITPAPDDGEPFLSEGKMVRYFRLPGSDGRMCERCDLTFHIHGFIDTLEGGHRVCPGDFIITGISGELYPCKPDIFEKTYEAVE